MPSPLTHSKKCILLKKHSTPDGMGGAVTTWAEGGDFDALIMLNSSMEAKLAEKQGVSDLYNVMVDKDFPIESGDYFKRSADGQTFRVTSSPDEKHTPEISGLNVKCFSAAKATTSTV